MVGLGYKAYRTNKQLKQVQCKRCEIFHEKKLTDCPNCSQLNEAQLQLFKDEWAKQNKLNRRMGRYFLLALVVVVVLTILVSVF